MNNDLNADYKEINDYLDTLQSLTMRDFEKMTVEEKDTNATETENVVTLITDKLNTIRMLFGNPENLPF